MTDLYAGSAGGQPRLLIPTIDQFQDPAVTIAMNAILRWANSLIVGGGSGLVAYADFTENIVPGTSKITWSTKNAGGTYDYLDGAAQEIIQLPANAVTLILFGLSYGSASPPANPQFNLTINSGGTIAIQEVSEPAGSGAWAATGSAAALVDDDAAAGSLPWWLSASPSGDVTAQGYLILASWSKP